MPGSDRRPTDSAEAAEDFSGFGLWLWILRPSNKGQPLQVSDKNQSVSVSNHHGKTPWSFEYLWPLKDGGLMDILTSQVSYLPLGAAGSPKDWNDTIYDEVCCYSVNMNLRGL